MGNRWLRHVFCSILKVDFFTLTFRQLERLVRGESLILGACGYWRPGRSPWLRGSLDLLWQWPNQSHHLRQVAEEAWVLTEELSPKMNLEVASGLFELYLTLADTQRFWSCIPGR